jgi:hypothetical protein
MIGVAVGQEDGDDVADRAPDGPEQRRELFPVAGQAGINDCEPALILEDVPVDIVIPETVDAVRDLKAAGCEADLGCHRRLHGWSGSARSRGQGAAHVSEPPALGAKAEVHRTGWLEASVVNWRAGARRAYGMLKRVCPVHAIGSCVD